MFCPKCGNNLPDNATFCNNCGTPMNSQPQQQYYQPVRSSQPKEFFFGFNTKVTGIILKAIALTYLLYKFIYGIVQAAQSSRISSYSEYFGISTGGGGGFGVFLAAFFEGLIMCAIVYGIGDIIERKGKKRD